METTVGIDQESSPVTDPGEPPSYLLRYAAEVERWRREALARRGLA